MQLGVFATLVVVIVFVSASGGETANPLSTVLQLLDDLESKLDHDQHREDREYRRYREWCETTAVNLKIEMEDSSSRKNKLEAKIDLAISDIKVASATLEDLAASISAVESDLEKAKAIRKKDVVDFEASEKELLGVVGALGRAIDVLTRQNGPSLTQIDTSHVESILQGLSLIIDAAGFTNSDQQQLSEFIQAYDGDTEDADEGSPGAPARAAYSAKSGSIVDALEDMREKAGNNLASLRRQEVKVRGDYEVLKKTLQLKMVADSKDLAYEKKNKASAEERKSVSEGELDKVVKDLGQSTKTLATLQQDCMQVATDHDANTESRKEETKVVAEASKILRDATGEDQGADSFVQVKSSVQLGAGSRTMRSHCVEIVKKLAKKQHSRALAQLASRISAVAFFSAQRDADPFAKVKVLITDIIEKLEKEADEEATEKAYCDKEMSSASDKTSSLDDTITDLTADMDQRSAKLTGLKRSITQLNGEVGAISKEQAEIDAIRQEMHADYLQSKADLEQGLSGVRAALGVLREYYAAKDDKESFVQGAALSAFMQQPAKPGKPIDTSGAGAGILGILEVVESDFATNLAKEEAIESDSLAEYQEITQENQIAKTSKERYSELKAGAATSEEKTLGELEGDRENSESELAAVKEYWANLKSRCIAKPESYEQRKKRREAEIQGLKEALEALHKDAAFFQRIVHRPRKQDRERPVKLGVVIVKSS